jgi:hypothetical protein
MPYLRTALSGLLGSADCRLVQASRFNTRVAVSREGARGDGVVEPRLKAAGTRRRTVMQTPKAVIAAIIVTVCATRFGRAAELHPDTLTAWNAYLEAADSRIEQRAAGRLPFLWMDELPDRAARVQSGEVVIAPVVGHGTQGVPYGLIHDWIGAIFIPRATLDSLWMVIHDYDNYQHMYRPAVTSSRTLTCADSSQEFEMVWQRKVMFVSAALDGHYQSRDVMLDRHRGYSVAEAMEVREIEGYGHTGEHLLPPDTGNGFIWRIRSVTRYEERDGGVYLELEAMALTRDIPGSLAWMVKPVVNRLSINSLIATLRQTRDAVISSRGNLETFASCSRARGSDLAKAGGE